MSNNEYRMLNLPSAGRYRSLILLLNKSHRHRIKSSLIDQDEGSV